MSLRDEVARAIEAEIGRKRGTFDSRDLADAAVAAVKAHLSKPRMITGAMVEAGAGKLPHFANVPDVDVREAIAAAISAWEV